MTTHQKRLNALKALGVDINDVLDLNDLNLDSVVLRQKTNAPGTLRYKSRDDILRQIEELEDELVELLLEYISDDDLLTSEEFNPYGWLDRFVGPLNQLG